MATTRKPPKQPPTPAQFTTSSGYDLMAGPKIKTTPVCPPQYLPQLGLNMGFDKKRTP